MTWMSLIRSSFNEVWPEKRYQYYIPSIILDPSFISLFYLFPSKVNHSRTLFLCVSVVPNLISLGIVQHEFIEVVYRHTVSSVSRGNLVFRFLLPTPTSSWPNQSWSIKATFWCILVTFYWSHRLSFSIVLSALSCNAQLPIILFIERGNKLLSRRLNIAEYLIELRTETQTKYGLAFWPVGKRFCQLTVFHHY